MQPNKLNGVTLEGRKGEVSATRRILEAMDTKQARSAANRIRSLHGQQRRQRHIGGVAVVKLRPEECILVPLAADHSEVVINGLAQAVEGKLTDLDTATQETAAIMLQELSDELAADVPLDPVWNFQALQPKRAR